MLARFDHELQATPDKWFAAAARFGLGDQLEAALIGRGLHARGQLPDNCFLAVNVGPDALLLEPGRRRAGRARSEPRSSSRSPRPRPSTTTHALLRALERAARRRARRSPSTTRVPATPASTTSCRSGRTSSSSTGTRDRTSTATRPSTRSWRRSARSPACSTRGCWPRASSATASARCWPRWACRSRRASGSPVRRAELDASTLIAAAPPRDDALRKPPLDRRAGRPRGEHAARGLGHRGRRRRLRAAARGARTHGRRQPRPRCACWPPTRPPTSPSARSPARRSERFDPICCIDELGRLVGLHPLRTPRPPSRPIRKDPSMKSFSCGAVIPGCTRSFRGDTDGEILAQVAHHARHDHGLTEISESSSARSAATSPHRRTSSYLRLGHGTQNSRRRGQTRSRRP